MAPSRPTTYINILMNKGDSVENIEVIRLKTTRQDLSVGSREFRKVLLSKGLGHSFWKGWLWITPLNGQSANQLTENISLEEFGINLQQAELYRIDDLTADDIWPSVGVILLRDAIKFNLRQTLKGCRNIRLAGLKFYDLNNVILSGMTTYVVAGVSLQRILRVDSNIAICPMLNLELLDTSNKRVEDSSLRSRHLNSAWAEVMDKYKEIFDNLLSRILPLKVNFSNKLFKFEKPFIGLKIEKAEELPKGQKRLDEWL